MQAKVAEDIKKIIRKRLKVTYYISHYVRFTSHSNILAQHFYFAQPNQEVILNIL